MNQNEQYELNLPLNIRFHRFSNLQQPHNSRSTQRPVKQQATFPDDTPSASAASADARQVSSDACDNAATSTSIAKRALRAFKSSSNVSTAKYYFDSESEDEAGHAPSSSPTTRSRNPTRFSQSSFNSVKPILGSDYQFEVERNRRFLAEREAAHVDERRNSKSGLSDSVSTANQISNISKHNAFASSSSSRQANLRDKYATSSTCGGRNSLGSAINSGSSSTANTADLARQRQRSISSLQYPRSFNQSLQSAPVVIVTTTTTNTNTNSVNGNNCTTFSHACQHQNLDTNNTKDNNSNSSAQGSGNRAARPTFQAGFSLPGSVSSSSLSYYLQAASPTPSLNDLTYLRTPSPSECESDSVQSCCSPTQSVDNSAAYRFASQRASLRLPSLNTNKHKRNSLTVPSVFELPSPSESYDSPIDPPVLNMASLVEMDNNADADVATSANGNGNDADVTINANCALLSHENAIPRRNKPLANAEHRMSLLGKPICIKQLRQARIDARWRKVQSKIYNFLERPKTVEAIAYHVFVFISVFICLLLSVLSTIDSYKDFGGPALFYMEAVMLIWFSVEYALRMWSAGCRSRYQGCSGRMLFARRPFCIIDFIVILASSAVLIISICHGELEMEFVASPLRALRFFQILRMMRMDRRGGSFKLLASVVWAHRQELFTTVYIGFLILISTAFLMYLAEKDHINTKFHNFADALWWGVITLCTVGYGDTVPQSPMGKIIASVCAVAGISFFALPAGILGSGFALKVQQHQRQKHLIRRRGPAAFLIQSCWRVYAADPCSASAATWKPHLRPVPSPTVEKSRFGRLTIRRKSFTLRNTSSNPSTTTANAPSPAAPSTPVPVRAASVALAEDRPNKLLPTANEGVSFQPQFSPEKRTKDKEPATILKIREEEVDFVDSVYPLNEAHKNAVRAIRKIKFLVARRKFREMLRPYDVKDVIEQYASGHLDMLSRIKILQARLEQILGRSGSNSKDYYDSKVSLAARIVNVERVVEQTESRMDSLVRLIETQREVMLAICDKLNVVDLPASNRVGMQLYPPILSPITDASPEESPNPNANAHSRLKTSISAPYTVSRLENHLLGPPVATQRRQRAAAANELLNEAAQSLSDDQSAESDKEKTDDSSKNGTSNVSARSPIDDRPVSRFRKARSLKCHSRHYSESTAKPLLTDSATQTSVTMESGAGLFIRISDDGDSVDKAKSPASPSD